MEIKQEESDFLDLSIVKEEYTVEEVESPHKWEGEEPMYDPNDLIPVKTEASMIPIKAEPAEILNQSKDTTPRKAKKKKKLTEEKEYICTVCSKVFHKHQNFRRHTWLHSNEEFNCSICSKGFKTKIYLRKHMKTHAEEPTEICVCEICNKTLKNPEQLKRHLYRHKSYIKKEVFKCEQCGKIYYSEADRMQHIAKVHAIKKTEAVPLTCADCGKIYWRKHCYESHLLLHTDISFNCTLCTRTFKRQDLLDKHVALHNDGKLFICNICGKTFNGEPYYKRHMATHDKKVLPCFYCSKIFDNNDTRFSHIRSVHPALPTRIEGVPLVCKICKTAFEDIEILREHVKVHSVRDRFECAYCGTTFAAKKDIMQHIEENHEGETTTGVSLQMSSLPTPTTNAKLYKPKYSCTECGKKFYKSRNHRIHITTAHTKVRPFECANCGKGFQTKETLTRHMKYHNRIYPCTQCGMRFGSKELLKRHERQHGVIERVLHCPHCDEVFRHIKILEKHVLMFHRDLETAIDSSSVAVKIEQEDPLMSEETADGTTEHVPSTTFAWQ